MTDSLKQANRDAFTSIRPELVERVLLAFKERIMNLVVENGGAHIENLA